MDSLLEAHCPKLDDASINSIDWSKVKTRLLIGASEVVNGFETVFDTAVNKGTVTTPPVSY